MGGTNDYLANYYGGEGVLGYVFLNAEESAYIFAKAMGYNGSKIPFNQANEGSTLFKVQLPDVYSSRTERRVNPYKYVLSASHGP